MQKVYCSSASSSSRVLIRKVMPSGEAETTSTLRPKAKEVSAEGEARRLGMGSGEGLKGKARTTHRDSVLVDGTKADSARLTFKTGKVGLGVRLSMLDVISSDKEGYSWRLLANARGREGRGGVDDGRCGAFEGQWIAQNQRAYLEDYSDGEEKPQVTSAVS